jgi:hypothetical protein
MFSYPQFVHLFAPNGAIIMAFLEIHFKYFRCSGYETSRCFVEQLGIFMVKGLAGGLISGYKSVRPCIFSDKIATALFS